MCFYSAAIFCKYHVIDSQSAMDRYFNFRIWVEAVSETNMESWAQILRSNRRGIFRNLFKYYSRHLFVIISFKTCLTNILSLSFTFWCVINRSEIDKIYSNKLNHICSMLFATLFCLMRNYLLFHTMPHIYNNNNFY